MRQLTPLLAAAQAGSAKVVATPGGFTLLDVQGEGPPVVLVHGMISPSLVWDRVVPRLVAAGHRVIRYDLYGRGLSARPEGPMTPEVYRDQLDAVVALTCPEPPVVVGYSWGAGIAATLAAAREGAVRGLVLVAPGGVEPARAWTNAPLRCPGLGEALVALGGRAALQRDVRRMFASPSTADAYLPLLAPQQAWEGYERCFLSTLRSCPASWEAAYAAVGGTPLPVDVLWGDADAKVPITTAAQLAQLVPHARIHAVPGGAHGMPWEAPGPFTDALVAALGRDGGSPARGASFATSR